MNKKLNRILWLLTAVLLMAAMMPVTAMATGSGYGFAVDVEPAPAAIGGEVELTVRLTDYTAESSGIRGFQIDIADAGGVLGEAVCTSLVTDQDNVLADDAKYQSSRNLVRHLYAKESGTLAYGQAELLRVRFMIPETYTEAGVLELPMTLLIQNEAGEQLTYTQKIEVAYVPQAEMPQTQIARNTATGADYATLAQALDEAEAGQTVILLDDCTEDRVMVKPGIILDLNGFAVTAQYVVAFDTGHIIDSGETGRMDVAVRNVVLDEENAMIPVYDGTGYVFTKAGFALKQDNSYTGPGVKINAAACPVNMAVVEMLKDGGEAHDVRIAIRLSWDTADGTGSQEMVFSDDVVAQVFRSNDGSWSGYSRMFSMVVTGFDEIRNLQAHVLILSGTNVRYVSSTGITLS